MNAERVPNSPFRVLELGELELTSWTMDLNTENLKEVRMYASRNGFRGSYYIDVDDSCAGKTCSTCRRVLARSAYGTRAANKYGLRNSCKECEDPVNRENARSRSRSNRNRTEEDLEEAVKYYYSDGYKVCSRCNNRQPVGMFGMNPGNTRVLRAWCMPCDLNYSVTRNRTVLSDGTTLGVESARLRRERNRLRTPDEIESDRGRVRPDRVKRCRTCRVGKSVDLFHRNICNTDGLRDDCIECTDGHRRKRAEAYWESREIPLECYICQGEYEDVEHVVPLHLGGPDTLGNLLPACSDCNRGPGGKFDTPLPIWLRGAYPETASEVLVRVRSYGVDPFPTD